MQLLTVLRVGKAVGLVAVGLAGLSEQDQRRRISGLEREREIEQDERIDVELCPTGHVNHDPEADNDGLGDKEGRSTEEAGEIFRLLAEPVAAEADSRWACGRWNLRTYSCSAGLCCTLIPLSLCSLPVQQLPPR